jgi:two-component system, NtrC family, sensor kinase
VASKPASPVGERGREYERSLFDAVPVPISVSDRRTGEVVDANPAFLALVGLPAESVVGARAPYPWETAFAGRYRATGGREFPVEVATHALGDEGLVLCVVTDLSERRRLDQQLVQSGKLAAIGELAAGVAHEINNPLLAILGLTEFLLKDAEPGSTERMRLELIQETGLEIKEIVRALLDFARENPDERHVVDLQEVVHATLDLVRRTNAHKGIELIERYEAPGARVNASPNQLKQLILNLVANARQAMPNGGVIDVSVRRENGHVAVVVTDEGPGIPAELLARIFEPFFTTRRATGGTGLGLPVCLGIAEAHGGTLSAASEPGPGAAFTLRLPVVAGGVA